ncbi:unnamed protein product [Adineta ricciae]|uniref:G-protein coupled receptors family 1 profile domain-containing protein n=1 Tax=Adineta ricciae TaxID=249248 RepID=A0A814TYC1_ADIRI|nr:unnamed protein product [Adineta ricciae]
MSRPDIATDLMTNFANILPKTNESSLSFFDYPFDISEHHMNQSTSHSQDSQHLATILQQLFSKMSDNHSVFQPSSSSRLSSATGLLSLSSSSSLPVSSNHVNTSYLLAKISLWFVLIVNPIVIIFGVVGNLLATYILVKGNIAKLPVSFYTIMLNISDTLNLLLPVFIFWLDNCFNRTPERGYFRDKSNFLCKALMCPDQLFAALSAWYMCAISFNRWHSVCRPSSYFFRTTTPTTISNIKSTSPSENHSFCGSSFVSILTQRISLDYCFSLKRSRKYRQHLQAFRCIGIITLVGILCCLYPIFMHELRPIISTNGHVVDFTHKITRTYAVVWKRCYYSQKHEYVYDIIGIILSSFLHILPLTSVAVMNVMIIVRLKKRRRLMASTSNSLRSTISNTKQTSSLKDLRKCIVHKVQSSTYKNSQPVHTSQSFAQHSLSRQKDQGTSTDLSLETVLLKQNKTNVNLRFSAPNRHQARDRNITIMLVSVALSYLVLTLPYRLFWSYNVYIKRMHPQKLNSSTYLLKMHHIDHVLRTIRNIHYGTNFIFFIFLSKPFRQKLKEVIMEKFFHQARVNLDKDENTCTLNYTVRYAPPQECPVKLENIVRVNEYLAKTSCNETPSLIDDARMQEDALYSIVKLEHDDSFVDLK